MKTQRHNLGQTERTVTIRRYVPWEPATSQRIWEACRQQAAAHNRAARELTERPTTPVRKSTRLKTTGLQGLWLRWREEQPGLATILQAIWRPGVALAKTRVDAWEAANERDADAWLAGVDEEAGNKNRPTRRPGRRRICANTLYCSRKRRDRSRRNRLVVSDGVRALDAKTVRIPGVGDVTLGEALPDDFQIRSVTLIERTPATRGRNVRPEDRSWKIHVTTRIEAPLRPLGETASTAGIDHGIVHALTVTSSDDEAKHLHYDTPDAGRSKQYDRLEQRKRRCRRRGRPSRKRRALARRQRRLRARALRQRAHQRRCWANRIAERHELVGIEQLHNANMRRSARGTSIAPGHGVAAKRGLNRKLAESSPGQQTDEVIAACVRHGARYRLVPAAGTSTTCARCGHRHPKNRESQAVFRCRECQHGANADANAAEVIRLLAEAYTGVGVSRPWAADKAARSAKAARRKAQGVRGATAARRSRSPEARPPMPATRRREAAPRKPRGVDERT